MTILTLALENLFGPGLPTFQEKVFVVIGLPMGVIPSGTIS